MIDKAFWKKRYQEGTTGWDVGQVSTPLKEYFDQLTSKKLRILIPGAGNAHEAEYLYENGFVNVTVLDVAEEPLENMRKRMPHFPEGQLLCTDFFHHDGSYDLIIEQTFFCALSPELRPEYARKMAQLLVPHGKIKGLLFDFPLTSEGPPFGGCREEYYTYFLPHFENVEFQSAHNSITPRMGRELWFTAEKPKG
ncbi:MAG: SAM-dependent methyltransferase [Flavobacteriales bacterium]|nr:SAM-dependent methyltransferase [Flavobacteriales bacterium]